MLLYKKIVAHDFRYDPSSFPHSENRTWRTEERETQKRQYLYLIQESEAVYCRLQNLHVMWITYEVELFIQGRAIERSPVFSEH
jgi:hypothetical protein